MYSSFKRKPTIACYDLMVLVFFWVLNLGFEIPKALEPFLKVNTVKNFIAKKASHCSVQFKTSDWGQLNDQNRVHLDPSSSTIQKSLEWKLK